MSRHGPRLGFAPRTTAVSSAVEHYPDMVGSQVRSLYRPLLRMKRLGNLDGRAVFLTEAIVAVCHVTLCR